MIIEFTQAALIGLFTLTILEVVLGIDNIVFISILADKVKEEKKQILARRIGLWMGMVVRIILLFFIIRFHLQISKQKNMLNNEE